MSGPKRNPDKLNTIGIVVVGICGAVMVYVTIAGLQAFYMNNTSTVQHAADYKDMDVTAKGHKADEMRNITEAATNTGAPTYRIPIEHAMKLVVEDAKNDPSHLVPSLPKADKATIEPQFGRPAPAGAAAPSGEGGQPTPTSGNAAPSALETPTGAGPGGAAGASPSQVNTPSPTPAPQPGAQPAAPNPTPAPAQGSAAAPPPKAGAQPKAGAKAQPKAAGSAAAQPKNP